VQAVALAGCGLLLQAGAAAACPGVGDRYCEVRGGRFLALPPPGWDGSSRLPATIFFHGWQSSAEAFARDDRFTEAFAREGVLLILPDGLGQTWAHQGSPSTARDEIAFMDAVRSEVIDRWPVDPGDILVTGFSQGGSMTWDLACRRAGDYGAFAAVSGAFWEPLPTACAGGPVDLLHIHGTADPVVPMTGRSIRDTWRQGDVLAGLAVLRRVDGCAGPPSRVVVEAGLTCEIWEGCSSGRELRLCRHADGHLLPEGWVAFAHSWARGLRSKSQGG
jgi:polyhydroxybutyrate depolymerase